MSNDKQSRIEALFRSYRESLPPLISEIESMLTHLQQQWDSDMAAEFDRKVHGLAGSAATFDLEAIGNAARELEHCFKPLLDDSSDSERLKQADQLFQNLKDTVETTIS